jgi:hypothetical protein
LSIALNIYDAKEQIGKNKALAKWQEMKKDTIFWKILF